MPLRIGLISEQRYLSHLQPSGMAAVLRSAGHLVDIVDPETGVYRTDDDAWIEPLDVVACRGRSPVVLSLLRWAELKGKPCVNRPGSISSVLNKAEMTASLCARGVGTPLTYMGRASELIKRVPDSAYPLILKPVFGDNCLGLRIVQSASELRDVEWPETIVLAQRFVPTDGYDLKLYGIGTEIVAVRKASCLLTAGLYPFGTGEIDDPCPVSLTEEMKNLAFKCAAIFGLDLFGIDCIETPEGLLVIEVNDFPNYTAVPAADERLADFVIALAPETVDRS